MANPKSVEGEGQYRQSFSSHREQGHIDIKQSIEVVYLNKRPNLPLYHLAKRRGRCKHNSPLQTRQASGKTPLEERMIRILIFGPSYQDRRSTASENIHAAVNASSLDRLHLR